MASIEILKMLSAGSVNWSQSAGGNDRLTAADVAFMMHGASEPVMLAAMAKILHDQQSGRYLHYHVLKWIKRKAVRESWKLLAGQDTLDNMSALSIVEFVQPPVCSSCRGTGYKGAKAFMLMKVCSRCSGLGYCELSDRRRAGLIGVDASNYVRTWRTRYYDVRQYLSGLECDMKRIICQNSKSDEVQIYA